MVQETAEDLAWILFSPDIAKLPSTENPFLFCNCRAHLVMLPYTSILWVLPVYTRTSSCESGSFILYYIIMKLSLLLYESFIIPYFSSMKMSSIFVSTKIYYAFIKNVTSLFSHWPRRAHLRHSFWPLCSWRLQMPVYPKGVSVLMPGQDMPTFIAHPAPAPCPPERIRWPSHQPPPFTGSSSNPS